MIQFFKHKPCLGVLAVTLASLTLTGCDSTSMADSLGMSVAAPDEFTVVTRPPLSLPPEFDLRPPAPGEAPRGATTTEQARSLLTGQEAKAKETPNSIMQPSVPTAVTPVISTETPSGGAAAFLKRAGAENASEDIRSQLGTDEKTPADTTKAKSLLEKLNGAAKNDPVVDAKKEAERLRNNKDAGKPATEGEVPVEKESKPSLIDKIF